MENQNRGKIVRGSAKEAPFSKGGERINVSLLVDSILELVEANPEVHTKGYVNLVLVKRKDGPDQYGTSHYIFESTFVPSGKGKSDRVREQEASKASLAANSAAADKPKVDEPSDDLPF